MNNRAGKNNDCLTCQYRRGVPTLDGPGRGYYLSRNGARMLVLERGAKQRVRVNGDFDLIVLETADGEVRFGIHSCKEVA